MRGTEPASILHEPTALEHIKKSGVWFLLTDGYIDNFAVQDLACKADEEKLGDIPIIFIIAAPQASTPAEINICIGTTFFAHTTSALVLYKLPTLGHLYPMVAKGVFAPLVQGGASLDTWDKLPYYKNEEAFKKACEDPNIEILPTSSRPDTAIGISLGTHWDSATSARVVVDDLLDQQTVVLEDLQDLLEEEAITQLAMVWKIRNKLGLFRALLIRNKRLEVTVRFADVYGAGKIFEAMQFATIADEKRELQERLRTAHAANRATYMAAKDFPSEESKSATSVNRLIDRGLRIISGFEKSGYTADILDRKSNRAMRAEMLLSDDAAVHLTTLDLSDNVKAFRSSCDICCGDNEIMSIVTKKLSEVENNITIALNFPLVAAQSKHNADMISSQCICFQCSLLLERSIYQEDLVGRLPTIAYEGPNKAYVNHQLTLAVTSNLATNTAGICQIFMTILDHTIQGKAWCSEAETVTLGRRKALTWLLDGLLANTMVRETFNETGQWVAYPQALKWTVDDFRIQNLESWIIQYPLVGFIQLLRWFDRLNMIEYEWLERLKQMKLIHFTTSTIMSSILHEQGELLWRQPFLDTIYREFNTPFVPRDLGPTSIRSSDEFWSKPREALSMKQSMTAQVAVSHLICGWPSGTIDGIYKKLQILIYWALYTQRCHSTAKTFFQSIRQREATGYVMTSYSVNMPNLDEVSNMVLRSLFVSGSASEPTKIPLRPHSESSVPPFVTPFGPSNLHCGYPGCDILLYNAQKPIDVDLIRKNRAEHLKALSALSSEFSDSQTGMPEHTPTPKPPTSSHINLHISVVRAWISWSRDAKKSLLWGSFIDKFVPTVMQVVAKDHRGDIYRPDIESMIKEVLPICT